MTNVKTIKAAASRLLLCSTLSLCCSCYDLKQKDDSHSTPKSDKSTVKIYKMDYDNDSIIDTLLVKNTRYGPGVFHPIPFNKVSADIGEDDKQCHDIYDIYELHANNHNLLIALEKGESEMSFPPLPADSLTIKPSLSKVGFRIENTSVEQTPEITFLDVSFQGPNPTINAYGKINNSHKNYTSKYTSDTCCAIINYEIEHSKRINLSHLGNSIDPELWKCK